jgi:hypothetical protein
VRRLSGAANGLWPFWCFAQWFAVNAVTLIIGGALLAPEIGSSSMFRDYFPSALGVFLALGVYQWKPLRSSGKWIWIPGAALAIADSLERGVSEMPERIRREFSGEDPIATSVSILTLSCALYSLTLFVLSRWTPATCI